MFRHREPTGLDGMSGLPHRIALLFPSPTDNKKAVCVATLRGDGPCRGLLPVTLLHERLYDHRPSRNDQQSL